jgi:cytochrome c553
MSKVALAILLLLCGCSSAAEDLRPFVAVAGKYSLMSQPKPAPAPSGVCSNCRGLGYLSDGRVRSECPVCKGTGKATTSAALAPCKDGKCPTPSTTR